MNVSHRPVLSHFGRLERLARRLLESQDRSGDAAWRLERHIIRLQLSIQAARSKRLDRADQFGERIRSLQTERPAGWRYKIGRCQRALERVRVEAESLQDCLNLARSVGDAFAWIMFRGNERNLHPLTENDRVPAPVTGPELEAILDFAVLQWRAGLGFPVLHDMTHCLRVGDVSFVRRGQQPVTFEIKDSVLDAGPDCTYRQLTVRAVLSKAQAERVRSAIPAGTYGDGPPLQPRIRLDARERRQWERMEIAAARTQAEVSAPAVINGSPEYTIVVPDLEQAHNWEAAAVVIQKARTEGYGVATVDDVSLYFAVYHPAGLGSEDGEAHLIRCVSRLADALAETGLWDAASERGSLDRMKYSDHCLGETDPKLMPFLVQGLPTDAKLDFISGRLELLVVTNVNRLLAAIDVGAEGQGIPRPSDVLRASDERLRYWLSKIAFEFMTVDGVRLATQAMISLMESMRSTPEDLAVQRDEDSIDPSS